MSAPNDHKATAENDAAVQYGVELLIPHVNAGETVWMPDRWYAEASKPGDLGRVVTRVIPPAGTEAGQ